MTSYGRTKLLSQHLRAYKPSLLQIAGGALASAAELLVTKASVDVVFHGEVETSLPLFCRTWGNPMGYEVIPGITFQRGHEVIRSRACDQISDLDTVPIPAYDAIDVEPYVRDARDRLPAFAPTATMYPRAKSHFLDHTAKNPRYLEVVTKRGCTHACFFCYRHMRGVRAHSVPRVMQELSYLRDTYNLGGFFIGDELFNHDKRWIYDFCTAFHREFPDSFYIVGGARVDGVDEEMLTALHESGCIEISYGQESGSDVVLKDYRKGVSRAANLDVTKKTLTSGLLTIAQIVVGGPSENWDTIHDTIAFLHEAGVYVVSVNHLIPLPTTPSWDLAQERCLIPDTESYLDHVAEVGGSDLCVNLTTESDDVVEVWPGYIRLAVAANYHLVNGAYARMLACRVRLTYLRLPAWVRHGARRLRCVALRSFHMRRVNEIKCQH